MHDHVEIARSGWRGVSFYRAPYINASIINYYVILGSRLLLQLMPTLLLRSVTERTSLDLLSRSRLVWTTAVGIEFREC